ncbi:MAG: ATP-binding protein [Spirulina sp. SIO3F2]|nr:ATP-binding protein [Spirulina sp. SIO3F2]
MEDQLTQRPFDNFRSSVTNPDYFFGRQSLLQKICHYPLQVRILLGGRRAGKTSVLKMVQYQLLNSTQEFNKVFPIFIDLNQEQPQSLAALRYLIITRAKEEFNMLSNSNLAFYQKAYKKLLGQITGAGVSVFGISLTVQNPDADRELTHEDFRQALLNFIKALRKKGFSGLCLMFDNADFIVKQDWSNDAWSYFRGLKDTDTAIKPFLGLILSGYRNLKDYQQQVGSPLLNIAEIDWVGVLEEKAAHTLIEQRCKDEHLELIPEEIGWVKELSGLHPYLTQQVVNILFDQLVAGKQCLKNQLLYSLVRQFDRDFSSWWDENLKSYGFSQSEQTVYKTLMEIRSGGIEIISQASDLSFGEVADILEVLVGTGVIRQYEEEEYKIGSKLFEEWVTRESS